MRLPFFRRSDPDTPRSTPIEILINRFADYISPRAREERRLKAIGNPAEREIKTPTHRARGRALQVRVSSGSAWRA